MHSLLTFSLFAPTPHSLPRPPHSLPSLLRPQGLLQLCGFRADQTHWFRWKEIDVLFTIVVTLLPRRTQPMADSYLYRQSLTGGLGGPIHVMLPVQVPDTQAARRQHGMAARQSRSRFPVTDNDAKPMPAYFNGVSCSTRRGLYPAFSLQVYTARAQCRCEPSMQTLTTRRTAIHKQGKRENVLIRLTLTVKQTRMCNNHLRRRNTQHPSNENGLR